MKKQYGTPVAEKVDFDYEENVVASGTPTMKDTKCGNSCKQEQHTCNNNWWWWMPKPHYHPLFWFFC